MGKYGHMEIYSDDVEVVVSHRYKDKVVDFFVWSDNVRVARYMVGLLKDGPAAVVTKNGVEVVGVPVFDY